MATKIANVFLRVILVAGTLLYGTLSAQSAGYYVSQNGNDSWSGTLPSPNSFNSDGPFQTLRRAQSAMEGSSTKNVYLRTGTYTLTGTFIFTGSDNGQTWQNYPGEAPVIDGASTWQFVVDGTNHLTFTGLTFQHYPSGVYNYRGAGQVGDFIGSGSNVTWNYNTFLNCINQCIMTTHTSSTAITNNTFNGQTGADQGPFGDTFVINLTASTGALIQHNAFLNLAGGAVGLAGPMGNNNTIDSNYINGVNQGPFNLGDIGAINLGDFGHTAVNNAITNNVILNNGPSGHPYNINAIYLDDETSNVTVTGNICQRCGTSALQIHGGDHITVQNNIFDLSQIGSEMVFYQQAFGNPDYGMCCNIFANNLVYTSGSANGIVTWANQRTGNDANPSVFNNLYYAAGGGTWQNPSQGVNDSSPAYANPQFTSPSTGNYSMPSSSPAFTILGFQPLSTDQGPGSTSQQPAPQQQPSQQPSQQPPPQGGGASIGNGTYSIKNNSSGLVLDDRGFSPPGIQVIQYPWNSGSNQRWVLTYVDASQAYTIVNQSSGGFLTDIQGQLFENRATGDATQLWVISSGSGANIIQNVASGRVIDDPGFSPNALTGIITWPINGGANQGWIFQ